MKKVRIMLTAIGVLAVVGGALAFKAKTFNSVIYCTTSSSQNCSVSTLKPDATFVFEEGLEFSEATYCTDFAHRNAPCAQVDIYTKD